MMRCELQQWTPMASGQSFIVRCYDATTNPLSTGWTLTYQLGRAVTGTQPSFCNLNTLWGTAPPNVTVRDVTCYNAAGTHANRQAMITYASAV